MGKEPLSAITRTMLKNPTVLYGRGRAQNAIFRFLLSRRHWTGKMPVIGIVGDNGVGKTTLADLVYHDYRVKLCFPLRCWVEVQQQFDSATLAKIILDRFGEDSHSHYDGDGDVTEPIARLQEWLLSMKKFLLVLDGYQKKLAGWETLLACFDEAAACGSAIIITSQKYWFKIGVRDYIINLPLLSLEDSYCLFSEHAFGDFDLDSHPELLAAALQIVIKLGGSPCAVKNLGSLLYDHHQDIDLWTMLLKIKPSVLLDFELLKVHCPELWHPPSHKRLQVSNCNLYLGSPPKMPDKHELMLLKKGLKILVPSVAKVSSELDDKEPFIPFPRYYAKCENVSDPSVLANFGRKIEVLEIEGSLQCLPDNFLSGCPHISDLSFINCYYLKHFADVLHATSLRKLRIQKCRSLDFSIPVGTHEKFARLDYLSITSSCDSLRSICLNLFPRLRDLHIKNCVNLESFSMAEELHDQYLKLASLLIADCPSFISFPERGMSAPKLTSISISNCRSLKSLPNDLATLTSLRTLRIDKCLELESVPGSLPSSLCILHIAFCDKLIPQKEWKLHRLLLLTSLEIEGGCIGMQSFPDMGLFAKKSQVPTHQQALRS